MKYVEHNFCINVLFFNFIFIVDTITDVSLSPFCPPPPSVHPPFLLAITTLLSVSMGYAYMFFG